ncbi:hypothetical protein H8356DRAFT_17802 [Neocallimastix lanati (nom. inval.)]|jgi:hypothetical protein|nr:hypothetical protein H8356DRAFT_17802 [Neocallimastix sp. JGI-2020a]
MDFFKILICLCTLCTLPWSIPYFYVEAARDQIKFNLEAYLHVFQSPWVKEEKPSACTYSYDKNLVVCNLYTNFPNYYFVMDVSRPKACVPILNNNTVVKNVEVFYVDKPLFFGDPKLYPTVYISENKMDIDDAVTKYMSLHRLKFYTADNCTFTLDYKSMRILKH